MSGIKRFLEKKLRLKVNEQKSAVGKPAQRKFLGFSFTTKASVRRLISAQSLARFKARVREMTRRGRAVGAMVTELNRYLRGWLGYYGHTECPSQLRELDGWIRRRLRRYIWRAWQRPQRRYRILRAHGVEPRHAWRVVHFGPWRASRSIAVSRVLSNAHFRKLGLYSLSAV